MKKSFFRPFFINKGLLISFYVLLLSKLLYVFCVFFAQKFFLAWQDEGRKILESSFLHQVVVAVQHFEVILSV